MLCVKSQSYPGSALRINAIAPEMREEVGVSWFVFACVVVESHTTTFAIARLFVIKFGAALN